MGFPFLFVCVCVSVYLYVTIVHTRHTLAKIKNVKKTDVCRFLHLPSNGIVAKIVLHDLDVRFRFQMFKICEIRLFSYVARQLKLRKNQQYAFKHLQSNDVSPIFTSMTLTYIFYFKCLKYVKFICFRMLPDRQNYGKKFSNTHSKICDLTA